MIRFFSGFLIGYMIAKRPPSAQEINTLKSDIESFFQKFLK